MKGKKNNNNDFKICLFIGHIIISTIRPLSFISAIQLRISIYIHCKVGSKALIDMLSTFGACCTYKKSRLFEEAACLGCTVDIEDESFSQFIFDNADFNINNIDGCNTFHAMGGIQCITPKSAVTIDMKLPVKTKSVGAKSWHHLVMSQ